MGHAICIQDISGYFPPQILTMIASISRRFVDLTEFILPTKIANPRTSTGNIY
ncbi:hypothetical protein [Bradyrhizobium sp. STM 3809]|uniref:hypothetical protein n=1 Tax=Bradyrhizobium sp. STM 3809 TaxID=551936 RepID=UPI0014797CB5|nr:hypothetical protein [Bradyrhizobium sp. STM 3809]